MIPMDVWMRQHNYWQEVVRHPPSSRQILMLSLLLQSLCFVDMLLLCLTSLFVWLSFRNPSFVTFCEIVAIVFGETRIVSALFASSNGAVVVLH